MGRRSRRLVPDFVRLIGAPAGSRWLDVGCGTGSLSAAILELTAPAAVTGADSSEGFLASARSRLPAEVALHRGSGLRGARRSASERAPERRAAPSPSASKGARGGVALALTWFKAHRPAAAMMRR